MAMVGYNFQPGTDDEMRRRLNGANGALGPMSNEALKIISLHLPSVLSGHPLSPAELMRPHVGGTAAPPPSVNAAGGRSELSQLMDLITSALHATPGRPTISPGETGTMPGPAQPPATPPSAGPVSTAPGPVGSPAPAPMPGPTNPFPGYGYGRGNNPFV